MSHKQKPSRLTNPPRTGPTALAAGLGLLVGAFLEMATRVPPFLHQAMEKPIAVAGFLLILTATLASFFQWSKQNPQKEKPAFFWAVLVSGFFCGMTGMIALRFGWWQGPAFDIAWPVFGAIYGFGAMGYFSICLWPYRKLKDSGPAWAKGLYPAGIFLLVALATFFGDLFCLHKEIYIFSDGYQIWHDVVYGLVIFALPFLVYNRLRART